MVKVILDFVATKRKVVDKWKKEEQEYDHKRN